MINQANLALLREALVEAEANDQFDITQYRHDCGSPSCIIGWAVHLSNAPQLSSYPVANDWLGLTMEELDRIYIGWTGYKWPHPTPTRPKFTASHPPFSAVLEFLDIMRDEDRVPYWREVL